MIKPFIITCIVLVLPVFFLLVYVISTYNRLLALRQRCRSAYSPVDAELKRRCDLVSPLIDSVKAHPDLSPESLRSMITARNTCSSANIRASRNPADSAATRALAAAETQLNGALGQLLAFIEAQPDLKTSPAVNAARDDLASLDSRIALARQTYNEAAAEYNHARGSFPANLIAAAFGFAPADLLANEGAVLTFRPS